MLEAEILADLAKEENETSEDSRGQQREISVAEQTRHMSLSLHAPDVV